MNVKNKLQTRKWCSDNFSPTFFCNIKVMINSSSLNKSLFVVIIPSAVLMYNAQNYTRILYSKSPVFSQVKHHNSFNARNVWTIINLAEQLRGKWYEKPEQKCIMGANVF